MGRPHEFAKCWAFFPVKKLKGRDIPKSIKDRASKAPKDDPALKKRVNDQKKQNAAESQ